MELNTCNEAKQYIKNLKEQLTERGLIDKVDDLVLTMIEATFDKWFKATQFLLKHGTTFKGHTREGDEVDKDYPQVKQQLDAQIQLFKYLSDFGGTASSRRKVKDSMTQPDDGDPLSKVLGSPPKK